jgi:hypothetical protein
MDSAKLKLTFVEIVEAVCRRPRMYTLNGTFGEALALLDGYAYGAKLGIASRSSSYFFPYAVWLHAKMNLPKDAHLWESFIKSYPDESTAIIEFARLYREYVEAAGDVENTSQ